MAYLTIDGEDYFAKTNFKFERIANEKYNTKQDGQEIGGFLNIYLNLLQFNNEAILQFWDCALAHYKKEKPTLDDIEAALEARIEADGDTEQLLKEAFQTLDQSGFFRKQAKSTWRELTAVPKAKKSETPEETKKRKEHEEAAKLMQQRYDDLAS